MNKLVTLLCRKRWIRKYQYHSMNFQEGYKKIMKNPLLIQIIGRFVNTHCRLSLEYEHKLQKYCGFEEKDLDDLFGLFTDRVQQRIYNLPRGSGKTAILKMMKDHERMIKERKEHE